MKWLSKLLKALTSRMFIAAALLLIQITMIFLCLFYLNNYLIIFQVISISAAIVLIIYIFNTPGSPSTKLPFVLLLAILPVFGVPFYLFCGNNDVHARYRKILEASLAQTRPFHVQDERVGNELRRRDLKRYRESAYIYRSTHLPVHNNTKVTYFPSGEAVYSELLRQIRQAEHFIFLEFFIIKPGQMWEAIRELLIQKAAQGVEIRLMYDDIGCAQYLPYRYDRSLRESGIDCAVFNPFNARLTVDHNYRDHRKIVVIDGTVGFTGGFNLADEYINVGSRFGHWKDSAVMLEGEAVWSQTVIFLENWDFTKRIRTDFTKYQPAVHRAESFAALSDGFVMPYADNPLDHELVGESVYMNIVNDAEKYVWFSTPYLIIDHEFVTALELAAKRGVDVRIITPGIPDDKRSAYLTTRSYYKDLVMSGVRVYEYTPGFIHAKNCVSDDEVMTCGTINMDYRSLYHHFETGVWAYDSQAVRQMKADFKDTLAKSREITLNWCQRLPLHIRLAQAILRIVAALM